MRCLSDTEVADASLAAMLQHMQSTDEHSAEQDEAKYGTFEQDGHESLQQLQRLQHRAATTAKGRNSVNSSRDRNNDGYGSITVRGPDESCKTCKGARGICRRWNTPGHLYDYAATGPKYNRPVSGGSGTMSISSLAAAAAASRSGSDSSSTGACV